MAIGFRIYQNVDRAPKEEVELFRDLPVANIGDAMNRLYCLDAELRPLNKTLLLGVAFTVKAPSGDNLMFHKAIEMARAGDILVIDGKGAKDRSLCGELMIHTARQKGIAGFVVDGCVRDLEDIMALTDFACYARGIQPNGPYKNGPGEINVPVAVGGQVVMPGDILVGDADGVIVIPKAEAKAVAAQAKKINENEAQKLIDNCAGKVNRAWLYEALDNLPVEWLDR